LALANGSIDNKYLALAKIGINIWLKPIHQFYLIRWLKPTAMNLEF